MKPESALHQTMGEFNRLQNDDDAKIISEHEMLGHLNDLIEEYRCTMGKRGSFSDSRAALKRIAAASMKGLVDLC